MPPPVIVHRCVKDKDQWLGSPKREEVLGPWSSPNIRTFVDPQDRTRVAGLMDVADMHVVMGAMQSKRWQMPWSTTGCWARRWSSRSRSRPLGARLASNFGRRSAGAMGELFCERRYRSPRRDGRTMWGVATFPVPGGQC